MSLRTPGKHSCSVHVQWVCLLELLRDGWKDGQYAAGDQVQVLPPVAAAEITAQQFSQADLESLRFHACSRNKPQGVCAPCDSLSAESTV